MSEKKPVSVRDAILSLTAAKGAGKSIAPEDAAKLSVPNTSSGY